ncbi:methyl-accepting chemotaxis protein [Algibacillus agarilyticus]|uniref:methyl-accepting chemotaxis protein n=1 Tax=Algibacillus agarilyticus TaxID=2234133 RepID=UPI000DD0E150|nr:methyl-accepting chemotaxis protein [Algibacillus agarilyticus]
MNLINNIRIKNRILILVSIPVLVALFFAVQRYQQATQTLDNIKQLETLQVYVSKVSPLISALYKERLMSKLYVGPGDQSEVGLEFKTDLEQSQADTELPLQNYQNLIANKKQYQVFPKLLQDINKVETVLTNFSEAREFASKKMRKGVHPESNRDVRTLRDMNTTINTLISSSQQVVLLSARNEQLSLLTSAYQNLTYAQNYLMLLIGNVYEAISVKLPLSSFANISKQVGQEGAYLKGFANYAPPHIVQYFNQQLGKQEFYVQAQKRYEQIRRIGSSKLNLPIEGNADEWMEQGALMVDGYNKVTSFLLENIEQTKSEILSDAQSAVTQTVSVIVALLIILIAVSYMIINSINVPLKQMIKDFAELSESKNMTLRTQINGNNELTSVGNAFNSLIASFEQTLLKVRQQMIDMDEITHRVAHSMEDSMTMIDGQKSATDSISVAINQMTTTIYEVAKMSAATSEIVQRANELSINGEQDAQSSRETMDELFQELADTSVLITSLNDEASQISNIVQVIKGISEQTNLLALNAAIEAARAGEMGRGFAVVADEVRELSKRTHDSTDQIQGQIEALISGASKASQKMELLQSNGLQAVEVVQKSSEAFMTIKQELDQITDMASQIAVASEEQTNVADEINERVHVIKDDSEKMFEQGTVTLADTQKLKENETHLKRDINEFHF